MAVKKYPHRWAIALAGIVMQTCLGTVYAWSVFTRPLAASHGWALPDITLTFTIAIVVLSFSTAWGGYILDTKGARLVATMGGAFFGLGLLIAGYGDQIGSLKVIYLGYGVIGGLGAGFGYITPIATLVKWFPDKRGLMTGLAVLGFGLGSGLMAVIAPGMIVSLGISKTFYIFGLVFFVAVAAAARFMIAPPADYVPAGWVDPAGRPAAGMTLGEALRSKYFYLLWAMLFINITAGLAVISQASPMAQSFMTDSVTDKAKLAGALMLLFSIFNCAGRPFWASISDKIGRRTVFFILFGSQAAALYALSVTTSLIIFIILICYIYACLGGGFATMPAYAADTFGTKFVGRIYGWLVTASGAAAITGPTLYAQMYQSFGNYSQALLITAVIFTAALIIPVLATPSKTKAA